MWFSIHCLYFIYARINIYEPTHVKTTKQWKSTLREKIFGKVAPNRLRPMMLWKTFLRQICISKLDWHIWFILFGFCTESLRNHNYHRCVPPSRALQEPGKSKGGFTLRVIFRCVYTDTNFFRCVNKIEARIVWKVARRRKSWGSAVSGGYSREFWIGVCREGSWTLILFKD